MLIYFNYTQYFTKTLNNNIKKLQYDTKILTLTIKLAKN